jgi:hypothetical protein
LFRVEYVLWNSKRRFVFGFSFQPAETVQELLRNHTHACTNVGRVNKIYKYMCR